MVINYFAPKISIEDEKKCFVLNPDGRVSIKIKIDLGLFSLPENWHYQIRIKNLNNNESIRLTNDQYQDNINFYQKDSNINENQKILEKTISLSNINDISIQVRIGNSSIPNKEKQWTSEDYKTWKVQQIQKENFSEWSNILQIKVLAKKPNITINGHPLNSASSIYSENSTVPSFKIGVNDNSYKIDSSSTYRIKNFEEEEIASYQGEKSIFYFNKKLRSFTTYFLTGTIILTNGYSENINYAFMTPGDEIISKSIIKTTKLDSSYITLDLRELDFSEEIKRYLLIRTNSEDNYPTFEKITYLYENGKSYYYDYNIENGIEYKYYFQPVNLDKENIGALKSYQVNNDVKHFDFSYLFAKDKQLKLKFNNKISNFKRVKLMNKVDTLGAQYPSIFKNGNTNYAEFSLNGLISYQMDDDEFFHENEQEAFRTQTSSSNNILNIKDEVFEEFIFRKKVEEFLNNGEPKLYKSSTEGNLIIVLTNVSLSPVETLNRMLYNFSATAYEIAEYNIDNLRESNILLPLIDQKKEDEFFLERNKVVPFSKTISSSSPDLSLINIREAIENEIENSNDYTIKKITISKMESKDINAILQLSIGGTKNIIIKAQHYIIDEEVLAQERTPTLILSALSGGENISIRITCLIDKRMAPNPITVSNTTSFFWTSLTKELSANSNPSKLLALFDNAIKIKNLTISKINGSNPANVAIGEINFIINNNTDTYYFQDIIDDSEITISTNVNIRLNAEAILQRGGLEEGQVQR